jgi:histidyl-tRNA synthetase
VQSALQNLGIPFRLNPFMVRGLDYYTRTTFEFLTTDLGAQAAVGAGGRYDGLIEQLGGPPLAGIGFAMGLERIVLLLEQRAHAEQIDAEVTDLFLVSLGATIDAASVLAHHLRRQGFRAAIDYSGRSLKAQLKQADRVKARFVLIIGDDEWTRGEGVLRNMRTQKQQPFALSGSPEQQCQRLAGLLQSPTL